jgi:prolyl oligopeptidase PreP (S9A serine peptidase family)
MTTQLRLFLLGGIIWMSASGQDVDKYQWLEDVSGDRAMAWVKAENARSAKVLESDPRFAGLEAAALKVLESKDRLAMPFQQGNEIYNTWQDAEHVRGILRRTTLTDYLTENPHWQTILDYDELGKRDKQSWVANGLICLYPGDDLCLVKLSAGGEDAETLREFIQTAGELDGQEHTAGCAGLGRRDDDEIRVPVCGETVAARRTAGPGKGDLSRYRERRQCRSLHVA